MTKVRVAGSCAEAQWEAVRAIGRGKLGEACSDEAARAEGISEVARVLGISKGVTRNMLDPDMPEQLSLDRAGILARSFGIDILARWLAGEAGGLFVQLPNPDGDLEKLTASGVRQVGEAAAQIIEAVGDGSSEGKRLSLEEARGVAKDARNVAATFGEIAAIADRVVDRERKAAKKASR
jgi:hypothetical protein